MDGLGFLLPTYSVRAGGGVFLKWTKKMGKLPQSRPVPGDSCSPTPHPQPSGYISAPQLCILPVPKATILLQVTTLQPHPHAHLSPMLVAGRGGHSGCSGCSGSDVNTAQGERSQPTATNPHTAAARERALPAVGWGSRFLWSAHSSRGLPQLPSPAGRY